MLAWHRWHATCCSLWEQLLHLGEHLAAHRYVRQPENSTNCSTAGDLVCWRPCLLETLSPEHIVTSSHMRSKRIALAGRRLDVMCDTATLCSVDKEAASTSTKRTFQQVNSHCIHLCTYMLQLPAANTGYYRSKDIWHRFRQTVRESSDSPS